MAETDPSAEAKSGPSAAALEVADRYLFADVATLAYAIDAFADAAVARERERCYRKIGWLYGLLGVPETAAAWQQSVSEKCPRCGAVWNKRCPLNRDGHKNECPKGYGAKP